MDDLYVTIKNINDDSQTYDFVVHPWLLSIDWRRENTSNTLGEQTSMSG